MLTGMTTVNKGILAPIHWALAFLVWVEDSFWESHTLLSFREGSLDLGSTMDFRYMGQVSKKAQHTKEVLPVFLESLATPRCSSETLFSLAQNKKRSHSCFWDCLPVEHTTNPLLDPNPLMSLDEVKALVQSFRILFMLLFCGLC